MLTKILVFILCFAAVYLLKELILFVFGIQNPEKYEVSVYRQFGIGLSIAYILTIIFTGLN